MRAPDLSAAAEPALVLAAQRGDQLAFAELVKRRQGWVRALLFRMCANRAEADDLAQEAFVRAWQRLADLDQPLAFSGWLRRVAVTTFLQAKRRARIDFDQLDETLPLAAEQPGVDTAASARVDLERALALLSAPERLCVTLNHGEGLSHGDIVAMTGLALGTVKSHIQRGSDKMRRYLGMESPT